MRKQIEFRNPAMKQYEKSSGGILPVVIVIVLLVLAGKFLFGAEAAALPHAELTRWFPAGGSETLLLDCLPESDASHFFCRVERVRNGDSVASAIIDEAAARQALSHFFARWPSSGPTRSTASGRRSLTWTIVDGGKHTANGEAIWRDHALEKQTTAVLALEGELGAQLSR